jgi:hypothetical protein
VLSIAGFGVTVSDFGIVGDQVAFTSLDGPREAPNVRTSSYDVPHRVRVSGAMGLLHGVGLSLVYQGESGFPFAFMVDGDPNADGLGGSVRTFGNDLVYVPRDARPGDDVSLAVFDADQGTFVPAPAADYALLDRFIQRESCLREQLGRIMRRNSCRNPWQSSVDLRLSKAFPTWGSQSLELIADLFNVRHFLNSKWGVPRSALGGEGVNMLHLVGYDTANDRGIYALQLPSLDDEDTGTRWLTPAK